MLAVFKNNNNNNRFMVKKKKKLTKNFKFVTYRTWIFLVNTLNNKV